jgi:amino acid transporter
VAEVFKGFELIPNAVNEIENPARDLGRRILISILITTAIYILVSLVAVGNLLPEKITRYKECALPCQQGRFWVNPVSC